MLLLWQMVLAYADFLYQTGLVDELQRDYFANKSREIVDLINQKKWLEAADVIIRLLLLFPTSSKFICNWKQSETSET